MTPESSGTADPRDEDPRDASADPIQNPAQDNPIADGDEAVLPLDEAEALTDGSVLQDYVDLDIQNRLWLKAVVPLLQLRSHESDPNGRVQFAFDQMYIAACERIARILGSDVLPHR